MGAFCPERGAAEKKQTPERIRRLLIFCGFPEIRRYSSVSSYIVQRSDSALRQAL